MFEVVATGGDGVFDQSAGGYIREQAGIPDHNDSHVQRELLDAITAKIALAYADFP